VRAAAAGDQSDHLTDTGNAHRLAHLHGTDLHYVHLWKKWLVWDGARWKLDETGEVSRRAEDTVETIHAEAAAATDPKESKAIRAWAHTSEGAAKRKAMIDLARSDARIAIRHEAFDADPWLLNCSNGTVDLRSGSLNPSDKADLVTKLVPVDFDPNAQAPLWEKFLEEILPDPEVREFVQRAVGYSLTGSVQEQILLVCWGLGANGKSTFLEVLRAVFGDYAMNAPQDTLQAKRETSIPNDVARLRGARLITCAETEDGGRLAESRVKQLTGGDMITARFMRAEWFEFRLDGKVWLITNHKPVIRGTDYAIWRRIRLIPFAVTIPEDQRDPQLLEKLKQELPGILAWAVQGCRAWQQVRLKPPPQVMEATEAYRSEQDVLAHFLSSCCQVGSGLQVATASLYDRYKGWCADNGEYQLSQKKLAGHLMERGFENYKNGQGSMVWRGIYTAPDWCKRPADD
jgi:putative DNA primase/helicase